jgi:two-component system, NtrC family, sensor kinase
VRRTGLQAEILLSLALVVATATLLLGALLVRTQMAQLEMLREPVARTLVADARSPLFAVDPGSGGVRWWSVVGGGAVRARRGGDRPIDAGSLALAEEAARRGAPLLRSGTPWEPIRFATPTGRGDEVAVAWLAPAVSPWLVFGLTAADAVVFIAVGFTLLRRRVVLPLRRLGAAAQEVAAGDFEARVPVDGALEMGEVARAFNDMTEALANRTRALEKAVADTREANEQLRRARAGLDRAERLAAAGRLAAGVAHEVGNPMGALLAFLELVRRDPGLCEASRAHLDKASRESERVRRILRELLDFSRPPRAARVPLRLADVAREVAALVSAQRRWGAISIELDEQPAGLTVLGDESVLAQVLLNLLVNAADALQGTPDPRIHVSLRPAPLRTREGEPPGAADARRWPDAVACEVADNGPGIPEEDRERIFDPFFTTKPPGEGTGLGLSNALRFAEELGGTLECAPAAAGEGARFVRRLPAAPADGAGHAVRGVAG